MYAIVIDENYSYLNLRSFDDDEIVNLNRARYQNWNQISKH